MLYNKRYVDDICTYQIMQKKHGRESVQVLFSQQKIPEENNDSMSIFFIEDVVTYKNGQVF